MTPVEFLTALLPAQGIYYASEMFRTDDGRVGFKSVGYDDIPSVLGQCKLWESQQKSSFFALGGFNLPTADSPGKRTQANARAFRACWLDLDVGPGKPYASRKAAMIDFAKFVRGHGIPDPTFVVGSGNGIHIYWAFTQDIPKDLWIRAASLLKRLTMHLKLGADHKVTANAAQVLRPIGVNNWKDPDNPKPVELRQQRAPVGFKTFVQSLVAAIKATGAPELAPIKRRNNGSPNSEYTSGLYPDSSAARAAEKCQTLREMRDTLGASQDEPLWYACLGVLAHSVDGDTLAHEWSSGHEGYDEAACQTKLEHRRTAAGPTTCETFREISSACQGCERTCKSPIQLGALPPQHDPAIKDVTGQVVFTIPDMPTAMTESFAWKDGILRGKVTTKGGDEIWVEVTKTAIYPEFVHRDPETQSYFARMHCYKPTGEQDYADVPIREFANDYNLVAILGQRLGVVATEPKLLVAYVRTWVEHLNNAARTRSTIRQMGWQADDCFVLGETCYHPDGRVTTVPVDQRLRNMVPSLQPKGDRQRFIDLIDNLYNRPNRLAHQAYWLASFASPLLALTSAENIGIPLVAYDPGGRSVGSKRAGGGVGKSTAAELGVACWGNPLAVGQKIGAGNTTDLALYTIAGIRHDLPVLLDEVTSGVWTSDKLSAFAYSYSQGTAKMQAKAEGGLRDNSNLCWSNIIYLTTNESVLGRLAHIPDSTPQIMRTFEIRFPNIKDELEAGSTISRDMLDIQDVLRNHHGHLGPEYIQYVVKNRGILTAKLERFMDLLIQKAGVRQDARYWLRVTSSLLLAFIVTQKLGFHKFDKESFIQYIVSLLKSHQEFADRHVDDYEDVLAMMINEFMPNLIVTNKAGHQNYNVPFAAGYGPPRGEVKGRVMTNDSIFMLSQPAIRKWCMDNRYKFDELRESLVSRNKLLKIERVYLGKGTPVPAARCTAWVIQDPSLIGHLSPVKTEEEIAAIGEMEAA